MGKRGGSVYLKIDAGVGEVECAVEAGVGGGLVLREGRCPRRLRATGVITFGYFRKKVLPRMLALLRRLLT